MATKEQQKDFIEKITPIAQKAYKQFGKPLPSICIAMAAVECRWGLAGSCKHHSYLGQKVGTGRTATKYWSGKGFNARTQEVTNQATGALKTIRGNFRAYDSMEQCVFNYYELLNTGLYDKVQYGAGYKDQMKQIKECGYMTSVTEVNSCLSIIDKYGLTKYDDVVAENKAEIERPTLRRCDRGEDVVHLQTRLTAMGYGVGKIDGIFGVKTLEAVKAFQIENGLAVDGIVGEKTWSKIG